MKLTRLNIQPVRKILRRIKITAKIILMSHDVKNIEDIKNKGQYHPNIIIWIKAFIFFLGKIVVIIRHLLLKLPWEKKLLESKQLLLGENQAIDKKKKNVPLGVLKSLSS